MDAESQKIFDEHFECCLLYTRPPEAPRLNKIRYVVDPVWKGVDRKNVGGYITCNSKVARRMQIAVTCGAVFDKVMKLTDVNGKTYIHARDKIYWKHANAGLKKLGY